MNVNSARRDTEKFFKANSLPYEIETDVNESGDTEYYFDSSLTLTVYSEGDAEYEISCGVFISRIGMSINFYLGDIEKTLLVYSLINNLNNDYNFKVYVTERNVLCVASASIGLDDDNVYPFLNAVTENFLSENFLADLGPLLKMIK